MRPAAKPTGPAKPTGSPGPGRYLFRGGHDHFIGVEQVLELDFVQFAVTAHQRRHRLAVYDIQKRLDYSFGGNLQEGADFLYGMLAGGIRRFHGRADSPGSGGLGGRSGDGRAFHVGGPVAGRAVGYGVFSRFGEDHEFMREVASDGAGIGFHRTETQPHASEDALVGFKHVLVADVGPGIVAVKGIGVLHHELASAHETETGADLVAELALNLIEIHGQLAIGPHLAPEQVGNDFLMRGPRQ